MFRWVLPAGSSIVFAADFKHPVGSLFCGWQSQYLVFGLEQCGPGQSVHECVCACVIFQLRSTLFLWFRVRRLHVSLEIVISKYF